MKKELRVYCININKVNIEVPNLNDSDFMDIAEEQGYVYTLDSFTRAFNITETITSNYMMIRFIEVECTDKIEEDTEGVVLIDGYNGETDVDFICEVNVTFKDKNGKLQNATIEHDGTVDSWDSKEIDGLMYDFNTYDSRYFGDSKKSVIGCGVDLLTIKHDDGFWSRDNSIAMEVINVTWVRKINQ